MASCISFIFLVLKEKHNNLKEVIIYLITTSDSVIS